MLKSLGIALSFAALASIAHAQTAVTPALPCAAQPNYPVTGIYDFATLGGGAAGGGLQYSDPLSTGPASMPIVKGFFVRCPWVRMQPLISGPINFDCIDSNIDFAIAFGKPHVILDFFENSVAQTTAGVPTGVNSPAGLPGDYVAAGGEYLNMINGQAECGIPVTYPLPWGTNFLNLWLTFVDAVAAHLTATNRMYAVDEVPISFDNADTGELIMQLSGSGDFGGTGSCTCADATNTWCTNGSNVAVPDQHVQWQTLDGTVSPGQGYTRAKMVTAYNTVAARYMADFPGKIFTHMSGYTTSENPTGGGPFNDSTPDIDDSGNINYGDPTLAALNGNAFLTRAQADFGTQFMAQANDFHGGNDGSHGRSLAAVSSNLASGGGAAMQEGQSIYTNTGTLVTPCKQNGQDGDTGCTALGEQIRGQDFMLQYGMYMFEVHPADLVYGRYDLWLNYLNKCYR